MRIGIIGINHKQASLALREKIARLCNNRFAKKQIIHPQLSYILLSTCNRTELYFEAPDLSDTHSYLLDILKHGSGEELGQKVYSYFGINCFRHLARVTAGLDSAILGETEIQGQVKIAYQEAAELRELPSELHFLFQKALRIGKNVRSHHVLRKGMPTLEETLYQVAQNELGTVRDKKVLFIGVSRINQTILSWFQKKEVSSITCCNRSIEKVEKLGLTALRWDQRGEWSEYDLVILGTKSPHYLIEEVPMEISSKKLIIDLSVPRNAAPGVAAHPKISLYNIDQLAQLTHQRKFDLDQRVKIIEREEIFAAVTRHSAAFNLKKLRKERTTFLSLKHR